MESNKRETQFEGLLKDVKGRHSKRMNAILATTDDDEEFSVLYFKILEYATPKLQRQELTGSIEVNKVTIERVDIPIEQIETE
jgi:hypothetical protein|tara:strand:+ start:513 stop:761 length:249 start_codon:yes stop_codon:yes gene_type:complete